MIPSLTLHGDVEIPQLGFGVFQVPPDETRATVERALEAGYRHIDTASSYGNESGVGAALRASGLARDEVFVTTKLGNGDHGDERARPAIEASLERLGLDRVDLYLIHWPRPALDLFEQTWRQLQRFHEEGLSRAIGVSNFRIEDLERLAEGGGTQPAINQIELHPYLQQSELREWHAAHGMLTEAWSPIAQGEVLGDPVIIEIAKRLGRSPAQVVLRWHVQLGNVVIPKSVTPSRIEENLRLFDFELDGEAMARIASLDRGHRTGPDPSTF